MKPHLQQQLALGALLVGAEAKFLSWPRDDVSWFPPRQTGSVEYSDSAVDPVPTSPARQPRDSALAAGFANGLAKRADDVCGYISGDPSEFLPVARSLSGCRTGRGTLIGHP